LEVRDAGLEILSTYSCDRANGAVTRVAANDQFCVIGTDKGHLELLHREEQYVDRIQWEDDKEERSITQLWLDHNHVVATFDGRHIKVWKIKNIATDLDDEDCWYMSPAVEIEVGHDPSCARVVIREDKLLLVIAHGNLQLTKFDLAKACQTLESKSYKINHLHKVNRVMFENEYVNDGNYDFDEKPYFEFEIMYMDEYGRVLARKCFNNEHFEEHGRVDVRTVVDGVTGKDMGSVLLDDQRSILLHNEDDHKEDQEWGCLYNPTPDCLIYVQHQVLRSRAASEATFRVWEYRCGKDRCPKWFLVSSDDIAMDRQHEALINQIIPGPLGILFLCRKSALMRKDSVLHHDIRIQKAINMDNRKTCFMQLLHWTNNLKRTVKAQPNQTLLLHWCKYCIIAFRLMNTKEVKDKVQCSKCTSTISNAPFVKVKGTYGLNRCFHIDCFDFCGYSSERKILDSMVGKFFPSYGQDE